VLGANAHLLQNEISGLPVHVVYNKKWHGGMSTSLSSGLAALLEISPGTDSSVFMVCDQPFVTPSLIDELVIKKEESDKGIIACAYNNTLGTPVLFSNKYFDELLCLQGAYGAKKMISQHPGDVATVDFPAGAVDIDTLADYEALKNNEFLR
jgi:molybdenum cofactor cytidylyltransferase